jgi:UDP-N-acetylmuramoyl-L-alanyl-D-glutamate--2,6-diaminopimelate ligase
MLLSQLLQDIFTVPREFDRNISGISLDSRKVSAGQVFYAYPGHKKDGRQYIADAIAKGAVAILVAGPNNIPECSVSMIDNIPLVTIPDLATQIGLIASRIMAEPAKQLRMLGVTGTNGKTSCSHLLAQCLDHLHEPCGVIGTLGVGFTTSLQETGLTTPDAIQLQMLLKRLHEQGAKAVAMEVSSHSIEQCRIASIPYQVGIFTNLTQDHLDYHGTMAAYAAVKLRFLKAAQTAQVVINIDDAYGRLWFEELKHIKPSFGFSINANADHDQAITYVKQCELSLAGITAHIQSPWGDGLLQLPLIGEFNLSNGLAVFTTLCSLGFAFDDVLNALHQVKAIPARMQTISLPGKPLVVIDYAHTPDALEKALLALRAHCHGQLICVFGCGGNRDQAKRPLMAAVVERIADRMIMTSDNPRDEAPAAIIEQMRQGLTQPDKAHIELDRSKAIINSIEWANKGDCIIIAGKGAERYQEFAAGEKIPFSDLDQAQSFLQGMSY